MDRTYVDNGCMWFVPYSHREPELRESRPVRPGVHVRTCDGSEVYCTLVFPNMLIIFLCCSITLKIVIWYIVNN